MVPCLERGFTPMPKSVRMTLITAILNKGFRT
jgi:hypothetical protein